MDGNSFGYELSTGCYSRMLVRARGHPSISYRPIRPSDLEVLMKIHGDLFPIRYATEFFDNIVHGRDILSWGAVDRDRPNDELVGFITARIVMANETQIQEMIRTEKSRSDQSVIKILTLGVVESYRKFGIATSLIHQVINYASDTPKCGAVFLHVISYNNPAISLFQKMSFLCIRKLRAFFYINGQHYDAYLFIYYLNGSISNVHGRISHVNGGLSSCSPL